MSFASSKPSLSTPFRKQSTVKLINTPGLKAYSNRKSQDASRLQKALEDLKLKKLNATAAIKNLEEPEKVVETSVESFLSSTSGSISSTDSAEKLKLDINDTNNNGDGELDCSSSIIKSQERDTDFDFNPYAAYLEAIKETTPRENHVASALKIELEDQATRYFKKKRPEFLKTVKFEDDADKIYTTHEDFEQQNENNFKAIFKFSQNQARKLNRNSETPEPVKLKRVSFNYRKESKHLNKILDVRHLGFSKEQDASDDEDSEDFDEMKNKSNNLEIERFRKESEKFQDNIYGHFAKKYKTRIGEYNRRTSLLKSMHAKAKENQKRMQENFLIPSENSENYFNSSQKTTKKDISSALDLTSYSSSTILSDKVITERAPIQNLQQDCYRNQEHSFRISTDPVTLKVQIFKAPRTSEKKVVRYLPRSRSVMSAYSHSNRSGHSASNNNMKYLESSRLSQQNVTSRPSTASSRATNTIMNIPRIPMRITDLNTDSKTIQAKCLSSLWKIY